MDQAYQCDISELEYRLPDELDLKVIRRSRFLYKRTVRNRAVFAIFLFLVLGILLHSGVLVKLTESNRMHAAGSLLLTFSVLSALAYFCYCFRAPLGISYGTITDVTDPAIHGISVRTDNNERVDIALDDETAFFLREQARVIILKQSKDNYVVLPE